MLSYITICGKSFSPATSVLHVLIDSNMISQCTNAPGLCSRKVFAVYPYLQVLAIAVRQTMCVASRITPSRMVTELLSLTTWEHSKMRS